MFFHYQNFLIAMCLGVPILSIYIQSTQKPHAKYAKNTNKHTQQNKTRAKNIWKITINSMIHIDGLQIGPSTQIKAAPKLGEFHEMPCDDESIPRSDQVLTPE